MTVLMCTKSTSHEPTATVHKSLTAGVLLNLASTDLTFKVQSGTFAASLGRRTAAPKRMQGILEPRLDCLSQKTGL